MSIRRAVFASLCFASIALLANVAPTFAQAVEDDDAPPAIHGTVANSDGTALVGGGLVVLRPTGSPIEYAHPTIRTGTREVVDVRFVSADGSFALDAPPGEYAVHVLQNAWVHAAVDPVVVAGGEALAPIEVRLPPTARLEARLRGGPLAQVADLEWVAQPRTAEDLSWMVMDGFGCRGVVDADGVVVVDHLPLDETRFLLRDPEREAVQHCAPDARHFAVIDLDRRDVRLEIDGADRWPGSLRLELTGHRDLHIGRRAPGTARFTVVVTSTDDASGFRRTVDERGVAEFRGLIPGDYRVSLRAGRERWDVELGGPFRLSPGDHVELDIDLRPRSARVLLVDEAGAPLRDRPIRLRVPTMPDRSGTFRTDDDGALMLTLPPGTYRLVEEAEGRFEDLSIGRLVRTVDDPPELSLRMEAL